MRKKKIKHTKTMAYHFNSNELVKRSNQDIKNYLQKFMQKRTN